MPFVSHHTNTLSNEGTEASYKMSLQGNVTTDSNHISNRKHNSQKHFFDTL